MGDTTYDSAAGGRAESSQRRLKRLQRLGRLLDSSIPLPGGFRMGLDGLIGLIPGFGDVVGGILSSYIVAEAARAGASRTTLIRMAWNVVVEMVIGAIPVLGDIFDIAWKANLKNVALLEKNLQDPVGGQRADRSFVAVLGGGLLLMIALVGVVLYALVKGIVLLLAA